jgi:hypothetical protein
MRMAGPFFDALSAKAASIRSSRDRIRSASLLQTAAPPE